MKAYVESGNVREIVNGQDPLECVAIAFLRQATKEDGLCPGEIYSVSETGFDSDNDNDVFGLSQPIIDRLVSEGKIGDS